MSNPINPSKTQDRIRAINQEIVRAQAAMHEIGGTQAELDYVAALVAERNQLESEARRAARRAGRQQCECLPARTDCPTPDGRPACVSASRSMMSEDS